MQGLVDGSLINQGSQNMYIKFGDSSASNLEQHVYNQGSGDIYIMYGDCRASSVNHYVYNNGSGDTCLMYGNSSASSAGVPSSDNVAKEWVKNVFNQGSGDMYIKYGNISSSTSSVVTNVFNQGSGDIKILYGNFSASKVTRKIVNAGSGDVCIIFANASSNSRRNATADEETAHNVHNQGSGRVYMAYERNSFTGTPSNLPQIQYNRESGPYANEAGPSVEKVKEDDEGVPRKRRPQRE